jgi:hypothetical protein
MAISPWLIVYSFGLLSIGYRLTAMDYIKSK